MLQCGMFKGSFPRVNEELIGPLALVHERAFCWWALFPGPRLCECRLDPKLATTTRM